MSLIKTLREPEIRTIFGKQELLIIEKQLLGVPLKPSEKTRLSRDIRKKFKAVKALEPYADEFNLKHAAEIQEIIKDTKEIILNTKYLSKIKRIILFGSTAQKSRTLLSDIDIAVEFTKIEKNESAKFRISMLSKTHKKVDIQVYNFLPTKIKKQIDKYGKTLYKRN